MHNEVITYIHTYIHRSIYIPLLLIAEERCVEIQPLLLIVTNPPPMNKKTYKFHNKKSVETLYIYMFILVYCVTENKVETLP